MADSFTTQAYDGRRNYQVKLVDLSDGTGLSSQLVVDVSTLTPDPGLHLKIKRIRYAIYAMRVTLYWDANTDIPIAVLGPGEDTLELANEYAGGWPNNAGTGVTGDVLLTTSDQVSGSGFTIVLECIKGV